MRCVFVPFMCTFKYVVDNYKHLLWSKTSFDAVDSWHYANVLVGSSSDFNLVFEGQTGSNVGMVALDDITLTPGCLEGGKCSIKFIP